MQVTKVGLTCVVSEGVAYLFCDNRIVWQGEPSGVRAMEFADAVKAVKQYEENKRRRDETHRETENRRAWNGKLSDEISRLNGIVNYQTDRWTKRLDACTKSIELTVVRGSNLKERRSNATKEWNDVFSVGRGSCKPYDEWERWLGNLSSNIRKRFRCAASGRVSSLSRRRHEEAEDA